MMTVENRRILELFVEKAARLFRSNFVSHLREKGVGVRLRATRDQVIETSVNLPDEEALDALTVTLRFFIQDNERISLRRLEAILTDPDISHEWKDHYNHVRTKLNQLLDSPYNIIIKSESSDPLTAREIFDTFIYGEIAHAAAQKRERYQRWKAMSLLFPFLQYSFHSTVSEVLKAIGYIAELTELELSSQSIPPVVRIDNEPCE